jgi:hypothetical protein
MIGAEMGLKKRLEVVVFHIGFLKEIWNFEIKNVNSKKI